jgi:hypothetical protein
MMQSPTQPSSVRLGKGQKHGKKKEAVVTGLCTAAPYPRTPQEVVAALLQEACRSEPAARPRPEGKELRAVRLNGHWDAYWLFHRQQQHQRLYGPSAPTLVSAEGQALEWAA